MVTRQPPLSMGFSRQEYWSGLPCPSPGELPDPRIGPVSCMSPTLAGSFFTTSATWEACLFYLFYLLFYFLTLQYCIGFSMYQNESATGIYKGTPNS